MINNQKTKIIYSDFHLPKIDPTSNYKQEKLAIIQEKAYVLQHSRAKSQYTNPKATLNKIFTYLEYNPSTNRKPSNQTINNNKSLQNKNISQIKHLIQKQLHKLEHDSIKPTCLTNLNFQNIERSQYNGEKEFDDDFNQRKRIRSQLLKKNFNRLIMKD